MKAAHGQRSERTLCCLWNARKGRAKQGADFLYIIEASCFSAVFPTIAERRLRPVRTIAGYRGLGLKE